MTMLGCLLTYLVQTSQMQPPQCSSPKPVAASMLGMHGVVVLTPAVLAWASAVSELLPNSWILMPPTEPQSSKPEWGQLVWAAAVLAHMQPASLVHSPIAPSPRPPHPELLRFVHWRIRSGSDSHCRARLLSQGRCRLDAARRQLSDSLEVLADEAHPQLQPLGTWSELLMLW